MSTFLKNPALTPTESLNATEIDFKILLMVLKYLKGLAPSYLSDLVDTFLGGQSDQQVRDNCSVPRSRSCSSPECCSADAGKHTSYCLQNTHLNKDLVSPVLYSLTTGSFPEKSLSTPEWLPVWREDERVGRDVINIGIKTAALCCSRAAALHRILKLWLSAALCFSFIVFKVKDLTPELLEFKIFQIELFFL